jgi:myosin-1
VPAAYVEEQAAPAPRAPPAPSKAKPAPPAKRPAAARKPVEPQHRDSGMSLNGANGSDSSRSNTPTPSLGPSLADALLARKNAMQRNNDGGEDW